ncbi:MAG: hypothetical protein HWQ35_18695 [Nostoc sp. NMS1]|uniref:hypothetical protein n=1 Tax=unclassified Nostoc TaxID=2593658 RepID=UPI0025D7677E|nr:MULTISPECIES: hypothetical protein [unclassified Nostoc]MBN3908492.1 hypothetical protein [Nostoc sp. NMS1]MBN3994228.1 hypothetical protein [Nostoc sp. NMS2]
MPKISQMNGQRQRFKGLLNERRIFPTPWHWCVHGLGIGQEATGFEPDKSERLLKISLALSRKTNISYHGFAHHLLNGILATCEAVSLDKRSHDEFKNAIDQLPSEPWQYARACALLTESLVKVGQLEPYRHLVHWHLKRALQQVAELNLSSDKLRYEQLQLFANLLLAVGQAEFTDLLGLQQQNGDIYTDIALQLATTISDIFYRGRGSAIIFSVLAIIGCREQVCTGEQNHLQTLLDIFDSELNESLTRDSDGVHEGSDYYLFPLSLILNAIAVLDCPDYLTYKRDWVEQAVSLYHALSPASQASQITFFIYALDNLGVLDVYVPDVITFFHKCMEGYIQSTDGFRVDAYLRCTYLIHLACQLGCLNILHPCILSIFSNSAAQIFGSDHYLKSTYGSSYMVAAYSLSAFDRIGKLDMLFSPEIGLPNAIGSFQDNPESTAINSPKTVFALIEAGLRMRPIGSCDTPLFQKVHIDK